MSLEQSNIFTAAGKSLEICLKWKVEREAVHAAREAFAKAQDPSACSFGTDQALWGIGTNAFMADRGWKECLEPVRGARVKCWIPNKKTKAGKELAKAIASKAFRVPDQDCLSGRLGFDPFIAALGRQTGIFFCRVSWVGERVIISVPSHKAHGIDGEEFVPEGAEPMTLSAYYALIGK